MRVIVRGKPKPKYPWLGRYQCATCKSVIEIEENDITTDHRKPEEDQREGWTVWVVCPVCEAERGLSDCDHVIGRCGGRGRRDDG